MKLLEHEGKKLFLKYGIPISKGELIESALASTTLDFPLFLKAQIPSGDRKKHGGIVCVENKKDFKISAQNLFKKEIGGVVPKVLLVEERVVFEQEIYVSFSYDQSFGSPVLAFSADGGSGISEASIYPINILVGVPDFLLRQLCLDAKIKFTSTIGSTIQNLWNLFVNEKVILAEINPLFILKDGSTMAGDAKVILDDNVVDRDKRPFLKMDGDIAIIASGGGASMLTIDILQSVGGKPLNYVEYSGNPKADAVAELTEKVLSQKNIKGCFVVGAKANFTDIYATMEGFVAGLRKIKPKPTYPIVIRRDGPRQKEAFLMLKKVQEDEGFNVHLFGAETSISDAAKKLVNLMKNK